MYVRTGGMAGLIPVFRFLYVHSVLPVFLFYRNNQLSELTCFRALKINGNGNSKVLDRRTKPFHQIVLLQTMHPVYETMGVFTVSDKIPRNSKVGYMPVWTEYRTHKMKAILEKADFSLFGASAPLWGVAFAPNCKSKIWRNLQYECTQRNQGTDHPCRNDYAVKEPAGQVKWLFYCPHWLT